MFSDHDELGIARSDVATR